MKHVSIGSVTRIAAITCAGVLITAPVLAEDGNQSPEILNKLLPQLIGIFVFATVMESALAVLFQWRLYREFFNGKSVKTLVAIVFGFAIVKQFDYDISHQIVALAGGSNQSGPLSKFMSALVLAGGSAAVYQLFKTLGLRPPVEEFHDKPQPADNKAWISIRIVRKNAIGEIKIHVEPVANPPADVAAKPALVGVIGGQRSLWERLRSVFLADPLRLPSYGGRTVDAGVVYRIIATGRRKGDSPDDPDGDFKEEIYLGRFAGRAIVDFVTST